MVTHEITEEFISYVTDKTKLYNPRGRSENQLRMSIECELHEYLMIQSGEWSAHPDPDQWEVDAYDGGIAIDVKFIYKDFWNFLPHQVENLNRQRGFVDKYVFMEWCERPRRPMKVGDVVSYRQLGEMSHEEACNRIRASFHPWFQKKGYTHYIDLRHLK